MSIRSIVLAGAADATPGTVGIVALANGNTYASATNPLTITTPASTQLGDVVYIFAHVTTTRSYTSTTDASTGLVVGTLLFNRTDGGTNNTRLVCVRVVATTVGARTYNVNWNSTVTGCVKAIVVRSGIGESVSPTSVVGNPVSFNVPAPQLTVSNTGSLLLNAYAVNSVNNGDAITLPVTLTPVGSSLNSNAGPSDARLLHVGYILNPALGLSGTNIATYTSTAGAQNSVSGTVVVTP